MKIISSFNSEPIVNNRWQLKNKLKDTLFINTLSILSLNEFYTDVTLYVDSLLYDVFKNYPVNVIKYDYSKCESDPWVDSKMSVLFDQTTPFVHIDTDVFLKKKLYFNPLADIVVERKEHNTYVSHYFPQLLFFSNNDNSIIKDTNYYYSFNCGVIGFNNMSFFELYKREYKKLLKFYKDNVQHYEFYKNTNFEPSIILEQLLLRILSDQLNPSKIQFVLNGKNDTENFAIGNDNGYIHYYGIKKYTDINRIKEVLENKYPYYYNIIENNY